MGSIKIKSENEPGKIVTSRKRWSSGGQNSIFREFLDSEKGDFKENAVLGFVQFLDFWRRLFDLRGVYIIFCHFWNLVCWRKVSENTRTLKSEWEVYVGNFSREKWNGAKYSRLFLYREIPFVPISTYGVVLFFLFINQNETAIKFWGCFELYIIFNQRP